jgi:hypothetical protein
MSHRHALILAINTSILAVLFAFTSWLYLDAKADVDKQVDASLTRSTKIVDSLARLRERELSSLAQSLATSPQLRGAAATGDRETIEDVLRSMAAKNGLTLVAVGQAKELRYGSLPAKSRTLEGKLFGTAPLDGGGWLAAAQAPDRGLLDAWSEITAVRLSIKAPGLAVDNLGALDAESSYVREHKLLDGKLEASLFAPRDPFWRAFKQRRDSLVVLGAALFFLGLILSAIFAELVARFSASSQTDDWKRLLREIEAVREKAGKAR